MQKKDILLWAYKKPVQRRFISLLTILVIVGIAVTNIIMLNQGLFTVAGIIPSFINQGILVTLFGVGYWYTKTEKTNNTKTVA